MHEIGIDGYSDEDVSVIIVWLPMLPSDSEAGAIESYDIMSMHRVYQFWDPEGLSGVAYSRDAHPTAHKDIFDSLPDDHFLKDRMKARNERLTKQPPMWDYAAFYPAGVEWGDTVPVPVQMIKQLIYAGPKEDGGSSLLYVDSFTATPVQSNWFDLVEQQMKRLMNCDEE